MVGIQSLCSGIIVCGAGNSDIVCRVGNSGIVCGAGNSGIVYGVGNSGTVCGVSSKVNSVVEHRYQQRRWQSSCL